MPPASGRARLVPLLALLGRPRGAWGLLHAGGGALQPQGAASGAPSSDRLRGPGVFEMPPARPGGPGAAGAAGRQGVFEMPPARPARSPRTPEEAAADFGGAQGLCDYWGWQPLAPGARRPRIFYGTVTGNEGQAELYELHFLEVSPFVSRIVAVDPKMTQRGHQRNLSLNLSLPRFRRFGDQLRQVELESPTKGKTLSQLSAAERLSLLRSGKKPLNNDFVLEQWTRAQMEQGFKDSHGNWEMDESDIVIVADSDEIPLRHFLAALQCCEVPSFSMVNRRLDEGTDKTLACRGAVLPLRSQVYEYFMDCPTKRPLWLYPNAALARCLMNGEMDFEDVRTSRVYRTPPPRNVAARHLHNVGMSLQDIVFKYGHYVEPRIESLDSGLDAETNEEMMWRGCDPSAPELGPGSWYMSLRPSNDFIDLRNGRGFVEGPRRGLDIPFALLEERPELAGRLLWRGHAGLRSPFAGRRGGSNYFAG